MLLIARILLFIQIVIIAAALGAFGSFFGLISISLLLGADSREGALAMGAAGLMPIGGLLGAGIGVWVAWKAITGLNKAAILGGGFGLLALAMASVGGWFVLEEMADGDPYDAAKEPTAHIEWRLSKLVPVEQIKPVYRYTMRSTFMDWTLSSHWDDPYFREENGKTILRFRASLRWREDGRMFQVWNFPKHDDRTTVILDMPDDPSPSEAFSAWQPVEGEHGEAVRWRVDPVE